MRMENFKKIYKLFRRHSLVSTDTRKLEKGSLFFALSGENFNGNRFAEIALEKGALAVIVDDPEFVPENDNRYILVESTLNTLQKLAKFHRQQFDIPILAITGTNGKTTTKELCAAVLSAEKDICATEGNFNNHIGVPLTLLHIGTDTEIAIVEMGANHPGEIEHLCEIAQPTHGLITNISKAHLEGFLDLQGIIYTKNELYTSIKNNAGMVFVNKDDLLLMQLSEGINRFTYGIPPADTEGKTEQANPFVVLDWLRETGRLQIKTRLYGSYNFNNIMAAIAVGKYFGISETGIVRALKNYKPRNNRSQLYQTQNNTLILDAYNANPKSMKLAIQDFASHRFPHPVLILGDMFELGKSAEEEHKNIVKQLELSGFQNIILIGKDFYRIAPEQPFLKFTSTEEAAQYLKSHPIKEAHILVKGSRGMQLEKLIEYL